MSRGHDHTDRSAHEALGLADALAGLNGQNVGIGFLDYGFDLLHPTLLTSDRRTRLACLWDQNTDTHYAAPALNALIGAAHDAGDRRAIDDVYDPHAHYFTRDGAVKGGAHGTLMASIAAGSAVESFVGVAPATTILAVQLALLDHHWKEQDSTGHPTWTHWRPDVEAVWHGWRAYDEAPQITRGVELLYEQACARRLDALVVNLSIGSSAGAHDGASPVERAIDDLVARGENGRGPSVAVIAAAGNAGGDDGHFATRLGAGDSCRFDWLMDEPDPTQNKLEIWYRSSVPVGVTLHYGADYRTLVGTLSAQTTGEIRLGGRRVGIFDHLPNARGSLSRVRLLIHPPYIVDATADDGLHVFTVTLTAEPGSAGAEIHAWVERDDGICERSTLSPADPTCTLTPLATAASAISVGGYDLTTGAAAVFARSSLGPAPWSRSATSAPTVSAPAVGIWGALSKTNDFAPTTGTSAATALVSGVVARLYQRAANAGTRLDRDALRRDLVALLARDAQGRGAWSPRYGHGAQTTGITTGSETSW